MEIDTRIVDDKVILTLRGPVTGAEMKDAVEDLMRRGCPLAGCPAAARFGTAWLRRASATTPTERRV